MPAAAADAPRPLGREGILCPDTTTKEEVRQLFEPSGEVECINLMTDCVMMEPSFKMYDQCHPTGNDKSLHADRA